MKTLTVRLSKALVADIETESRARNVSRSDIVRERLQQRSDASARVTTLDLIRDLVGSVDGMPPDMSAEPDHYLRARGYGKNRSGRHRVSRRSPQST